MTAKPTTKTNTARKTTKPTRQPKAKKAPARKALSLREQLRQVRDEAAAAHEQAHVSRMDQCVAAVEAIVEQVTAGTPGLDGDQAVPAGRVGEVIQPKPAKAKKKPTYKQAHAALTASIMEETGADRRTAKLHAEQWMEAQAAGGVETWRESPSTPAAAHDGVILEREPGSSWFHVYIDGERAGAVFKTTRKGAAFWAAETPDRALRAEGTNRAEAVDRFMTAYRKAEGA